MDCISLEGLAFRCAVGVTGEERKLKNDVLLDIFLFLDLGKTGLTENIDSTVDYEKVFFAVSDIMKGEFILLETIANRVIKIIRSDFPMVQKVKVRIAKLHPPVEGLHKVSVEITG